MKYSKDLISRSERIVQEVKEAEKLKKPIEHLVREQLAIMNCQRDEFIKNADNLGIDELSKARVEIQMYSNMKFWAKKIGLPVDKYDKLIQKIQKRFWG